MADDIKMEFDKLELAELRRYLRKAEKNVGNLRPVMVYAVSVMAESVADNFRLQGRAPHVWPKLSESTIEKRKKEKTWPGTKLERFGTLKQSLQVGTVGTGSFKRIAAKSAEYGTTLVKARGLQFGLKEKSGTAQIPEHQRDVRGQLVTVSAHSRSFRFGSVPSRPFIYWRGDDIKRIMSFAAAFAFDPDAAAKFGTAPTAARIPKALFLGVG